MIKKLVTLFHPERFQGWGVSKKYFEGWYFKIINADGSKAFAIIPGIAIDPLGNKHAFIQILDGKKETAQYLKFSAGRFSSTHRSFEVNLAGCYFSKEKMTLCLPEIHGSLAFSNNFPWPSSTLSPGIMGPFTFVPFMECYHGIISMNNNLSGSLTINGELIDFTGGKGYIEKDWGHSFPEAYVWMQTNHFNTEETSLKLSVAKIPWLKNSFTGFIVGFLLNGKLYRFTTYNKTKLLKCAIDQQNVEIVMQNKAYHIVIKVKRNRATALAAPINGLMDGKIEESMSAAIDVKLTQNSSNKVIYEGTGVHAGLEVAGKVSELIM